jgi:hypothetical protein
MLHLAAGRPRLGSLRSTSASSTSSPSPSAARIGVPFWTRGSWLDGARFRSVVPTRLRIWRRPRFNFRFGGFWFG